MLIEEFQGEYRWLSNFAYLDTPMKYDVFKDGSKIVHFTTNEHYYVAMKTLSIEKRIEVANHPLKGVKRFGTKLPMRSDWNKIKLDVMLFGIRYKFSKRNPTLRQKLIDTGDAVIEEGNNWGDLFWGVDNFTRQGHNHLGKILMQVRKEIMIEENLY